MRVEFQVGIVGAGFGGIIAAHELKRAGRDSFVIFERANQVGGVWRDNVYPGCTCDVRSNLYSLASKPNPHWTSSYAGQREILQYLQDLVTREDLQRHIQYDAKVSEVRFVEREGCWQIYVDSQLSCRVRALILATGPHSRPFIPAIPGVTTFQGTSFHSSAWDPSIDVTGKKVAVIGTGASAIQIVPNIAPAVSQLSLFQRTPAWIIPRGERKVSRFEKWLFGHLPLSQIFMRGAIYWLTEVVGMAFMGDAILNRILTSIALRKLAREVADPQTRKNLTPDYKLGCKRVLLSDDFYPALNRRNVQLVNDRIDKITPSGIQTVDGRVHEVDLVVFATGFIVADTDNYLRVVGRDGRVLTEVWNESGAEAYLGINVAGFPNLALLLGPNSGLGHSSALHVMESQMNYVMNYLVELDSATGNASLDVRPELQKLYNIDLQRRLKRTVWAAGCQSWYLDRKGRNTTVYPGLTWQYRRLTRHFHRNAYLLLNSNGGPKQEEAMTSCQPLHS